MTKTLRPRSSRLPDIRIGHDDLTALTRLAQNVGGHLAQAADQLLMELERARPMASSRLPDDCVRMHDHVGFTAGTGPIRHMQLVLPDDADISTGKISVLTPVGAALIGLSVGQSISFAGPKGDVQSLTVTSVARGQ